MHTYIQIMIFGFLNTLKDHIFEYLNQNSRE